MHSPRFRIVLGPDPIARRRTADRLADLNEVRAVHLHDAHDSCADACRSVAAAVDAGIAAGRGRVISAPSDTRPQHLFELLGSAAERTSLVVHVDPALLLVELADERLIDDGEHQGSLIARSSVIVEQIEHADVLVVDHRRAPDADALSRLLALLSHLAPDARLVLPRGAHWRDRARSAGTRRIPVEPGWVKVLNGDHAPSFADPRVSTLRYTSPVPFHPRRVLELLQGGWSHGDFGAIIRSAGFCRFATRPGVTGFWDQAGGSIGIEPAARDTLDGPLSAGQDLAITGFALDAAALTAALDACTLRPDELLAGPELWAKLVDPLPEWQPRA
jgi:G3E family GTPase